VSAPAYLSGAWEPTSASWMILAIFSSINALGHEGSNSPHLPDLGVGALRGDYRRARPTSRPTR
jgi:hypothetical protein